MKSKKYDSFKNLSDIDEIGFILLLIAVKECGLFKQLKVNPIKAIEETRKNHPDENVILNMTYWSSDLLRNDYLPRDMIINCHIVFLALLMQNDVIYRPTTSLILKNRLKSLCHTVISDNITLSNETKSYLKKIPIDLMSIGIKFNYF